MSGILPTSDGHHDRADLRLLNRAIRERWPIPDHYRDKMPSTVWDILNDPHEGTREKLRAVELILRMDQLNQTQEQFEEKNQRADDGKADGKLIIEVAYVDRPSLED